MDIFECFRFVNILKNSLPLVFNLESEVPENKKAPRKLVQKVLLWIVTIYFLIAAGTLLYSAVHTLQFHQEMVENILGVLIFLDNYNPIICHTGLFLATREPLSILMSLHEIDEFLYKQYGIAMDYRPRRMTFLRHALIFEGSFLFIMIFFCLDYTAVVNGIMTDNRYFKSVVMTYFILIWIIFILQLIVYSTIVSIIRDKVQVIRKCLRAISQEHRIMLFMLISASIECANSIGNGIIGLFVAFSTFYITQDIYVIYRFRNEHFDLNLYSVASGLYMLFIIALNIYLVTPAYCLKIELGELNKLIATGNNVSFKDLGTKKLVRKTWSIGVYSRILF